MRQAANWGVSAPKTIKNRGKKVVRKKEQTGLDRERERAKSAPRHLEQSHALPGSRVLCAVQLTKNLTGVGILLKQNGAIRTDITGRGVSTQRGVL